MHNTFLPQMSLVEEQIHSPECGEIGAMLYSNEEKLSSKLNFFFFKKHVQAPTQKLMATFSVEHISSIIAEKSSSTLG